MSKTTRAILAVALIVAGTGLGCLLGQAYKKIHYQSEAQKPVLNAQEQPRLVDPDTQVVFEQEFTRCQHVIISAFPQREQLNGRKLEELQQIYSAGNGYQIVWQGKTLIIHQKINDWCSNDKGKLRFKEYQNMVAVYQGPDAQHDSLLRVTKIPVNSLPEDIQSLIRQGKLEFNNQEEINDALENLDEYH